VLVVVVGHCMSPSCTAEGWACDPSEPRDFEVRWADSDGSDGGGAAVQGWRRGARGGEVDAVRLAAGTRADAQ
jgi:hypothetical protein